MSGSGGSAQVRSQVNAADVIATSVVAYAEARPAFARLRRERPASGKRHRERVGQLDRDLDWYAVVELTSAVARSAGELAKRRAEVFPEDVAAGLDRALAGFLLLFRRHDRSLP